MELPRLKLSGAAKLASYSSPALPSVFLPKVPLLRPLKCVGAAQKVGVPRPPALRARLPWPPLSVCPSLGQTETQKDIKPSLKQYRLPTIERRGGGD